MTIKYPTQSLRMLLTFCLIASLYHAGFAQGTFWGMTTNQGNQQGGTIFITNASGTGTRVLYHFNQATGSNPAYTHLIKASNGKLYGMTHHGGEQALGTIFEFDPPTTTYTKKHDFDGPYSGANPAGSLVQARNGKLYGMTRLGGSNSLGVLFEFDIVTSTYTKKLDFVGGNGASVHGSLTVGPNGFLYGMTVAGGAFDSGVLFLFDPVSGDYKKLFDFDAANGANPFGDLLLAQNGKFYGMTQKGGSTDQGVIFEFDPRQYAFRKIGEFNGDNGANPMGSLMQATNGKLYGATYQGGANDLGVLFEFDPNTLVHNKLYDFNQETGSNPVVSPSQSTNGKLYGVTAHGGFDGVLYEFDLNTNTYTMLNDFNYEKGVNPQGGLLFLNDGLIDVTMEYRLTNQFTGVNMAMEAIARPDGSIKPMLRPVSNNTAQLWQFKREANGYYRLINKNHPTKSLDVINDGKLNYNLWLAPSGNYSGQYWNITKNVDGSFRLTSIWQSAKSLDVLNAGKKDELIINASGQYSGQYWDLSPAVQTLIAPAPPPSTAPSLSINLNNQLVPGQELLPGNSVNSANGKYMLIQQEDGNLVVYVNKNVPIWASNTWGRRVKRCIMQKDGNLVIYDNFNQPIWASNTHGNENSKLIMTDHGDLILQSQDGRMLWHTDSGEK